MKPKAHLRTCAALALLALPGIAWAERIPGQMFDNFPQHAWLESYDPTLISSRVFVEGIYESYDNDTDVFKIENTLRWGIPINNDLAFGFQVMLPVKWVETADDDASGLGDLEARAGIVGHLSSCLRYGIGVNAVMDTASDDLLGDDAFVLRPIVAIRWDVTNRITTGFNVEYNVTPWDEEASDVSALELKFPVVFKISDCWSAFVSYNPRWNFLDESNRQRLELSTTWLWGPAKQYALTLGTELPLDSESFEYKLAAGFHWYF
jgi:hypothetical protein